MPRPAAILFALTLAAPATGQVARTAPGSPEAGAAGRTERIDLRAPTPVQHGIGPTRFVNRAASRTALLATTEGGLSAVLPRDTLNLGSGDSAPGTLFVIGEMPDWVARQYGFATPDANRPPPPGLLDRAIRPISVGGEARAITTTLAQQVFPIPTRAANAGSTAGLTTGPVTGATATASRGREQTIAMLLQRALEADHARGGRDGS